MAEIGSQMTSALRGDGAFAGDAAADADVGDYVALLKPRVMSLVIFTALTGMIITPGAVDPILGLIALFAIATGAGASGALNMWYDADIDAVMTRTARRPIPAGRIQRDAALAFGLILSVLSVMVLGLSTNWLAAALLAFTIVFYVVIYTMWLKRWTAQNIVIGGAAGALPPVVGWTAVTGSLSVEPFVLFGLIFLWTPPHFWALALFRRGDYARARIPMLPVVAGERATRIQILGYSLVLAVAGPMPWILGFSSPVFGVLAIGLGAEFLRRALRVWRMAGGDNFAAEKSLFGYSILYLFGIFLALLGEAVVARLAF